MKTATIPSVRVEPEFRAEVESVLGEGETLSEFVVERELQRDGGDLELAERALAAIRSGFATLKASPFTCRKAAQSPFLRELVIPFGHSGYVALFEIEGPGDVVVIAVRHQLEDDYH